MAPKILLANSDTIGGPKIRKLLTDSGYLTDTVESLEDVKDRLSTDEFLAVVLDLDSVKVENRTMRDMVRKYPGTPFLCTSRYRFHPELEDAISHHIFACITKPVDPDELLFWLKCIRDDHNGA